VKQTEREITTKGRLQEKNRKPKRQEHNTNEEAPRQESANIKTSAKCEHIDNKMHETMSKTIAENKASTQLYMQTQNAKNQAVKYTNNYAQHI